MPKGPRGEKRRADVIDMPVKVMRSVTDEETEELVAPINRRASTTKQTFG